MNKIVKIKFGSHLYGTNTPQSDVDYKSIYMPTREQILLSRFPKNITTSTGGNNTKNSADDVDNEIFSLHRFIELACEGQTVAIDMLHAPDAMIMHTSDIWQEIVKHREKFYTKNLRAFVGYCRRQAAKYGVKGSRLNAAREVFDYLMTLPETSKMRDVWVELPTGEHIHYMPPNSKDTNNCRIYQVCGKKFLESVGVGKVCESLSKFIEEFGGRAKMAAENKGIDWKALSHALRAAFQLEEIYTKGTIVFPLKRAEYLKSVKLGHCDYLTEVAPMLECLMERVEALSAASDLPDKVDVDFWDNFIIGVVANEVKK